MKFELSALRFVFEETHEQLNTDKRYDKLTRLDENELEMVM